MKLFSVIKTAVVFKTDAKFYIYIFFITYAKQHVSTDFNNTTTALPSPGWNTNCT